MRAQSAAWFPFVLAILLPIAGLIYGIIQISGGERDTGTRVVIVAVLAGIAQAVFFLA